MGAELQSELSPGRQEVWDRVVRPLARELTGRAGVLSLAVLDRIRPQLPELFPDVDAGEAIRAGAEACIREAASLMAQGADPRSLADLPARALDSAREGIRRGAPLTALLRGYRLGHAVLWDAVAAELASRARDREDLALAVEICSSWLFAYVDTALTLADDDCLAERDRSARGAAAARTETIDAILAGDAVDGAVASGRLDYELDREHVGLIAWLDAEPDGADAGVLLERAVAQITEATGASDALIQPLGALEVAAWVSGGAPLDLRRLADLRLDARTIPGVHVAAGDPASGVAGLRSTHEEARQARRVAVLAGRAPGTVTRYATVALQAIASVDVTQARAFVHRQLAGLFPPDDTARRLTSTLRVYLDEHASRSRAAKRLGLHENTISYRIRQVEDILGRDVDGDTLDLRVALALLPLAEDQEPPAR